MFLIKYDNQIVDTFHQQGNLFASRLPMTSNSVDSLPTFNLDWHLVLGHPSDSYIRFFLKERKIKGKFTLSADFPVCQQLKLKTVLTLRLCHVLMHLSPEFTWIPCRSTLQLARVINMCWSLLMTTVVSTEYI
ncbi:hypothetical protein O181_048036 [Austropuccinia psidii MF-1]|uniref:GAG-pre-integrase domain-containing protein n=1 Tax=Austropuccinia psidii MF-1 TaxID=1389203 RepID=A0A9Q3DPX2_9BASI|nr:hypothetical protein [Austropuccinia psidii MF-1]